MIRYIVTILCGKWIRYITIIIEPFCSHAVQAHALWHQGCSCIIIWHCYCFRLSNDAQHATGENKTAVCGVCARQT